MADKERTKKGARPRASLVTRAIILLLLAGIGWQLYSLNGQIEAAQAENEEYAALVAQQRQENAALEADIAQGPTDEKIEEIARDALGFVKPGEYVFDIGG